MGDEFSYARTVTKLLINEVLRYWRNRRTEPCPFPPEFIASVAYNLDENNITHRQAKDYLKRFIEDTYYRDTVYLMLETMRRENDKTRYLG